jgi:hypothetical protein
MKKILREMRREIAGLKRAAEDQQTFEEAIKGRKFKNPETGNQVNFGSLPAEEQKKLRAEFDKSQKKKGPGESSSPSAFEDEARKKMMAGLDGALKEIRKKYYAKGQDGGLAWEYGQELTKEFGRQIEEFLGGQGWDSSFSEAEVLSTIGKETGKMMSLAKVVQEGTEKMAAEINKMIKKENAERKVSATEWKKCKDKVKELRELSKDLIEEKEKVERWWEGYDTEEIWEDKLEKENRDLSAVKAKFKEIEKAEERMAYYHMRRGQEERKPVKAEDILKYSLSITKDRFRGPDKKAGIKILMAVSVKTLEDCQKAEEARKEEEKAKEVEKQVKTEFEKKKKEFEEGVKKERKSITKLFDDMEGGKLTPEEAIYKLAYLEGLHSASPYGKSLEETFKETKAKIEKKRKEESASFFGDLKKLLGFGKKKKETNKKATLKTARLTAEALRDEVKSLKRNLR